MTTIYRASIVEQLLQFYGNTLIKFEKYDTIADHLSAIANKMYEGVIAKNEGVITEISNYHKTHLGHSVESILSSNFSLTDCQTTIAHEYGFNSWEELVQKSNTPYHLYFETAVQSIISGDLIGLKNILIKYPKIITERSQYGHQATLLHYTASNGVEFWRQQVPSNLSAITSLLLEAGAEQKATMNVYGGQHTTYELLITSAHPYAAHVITEMKAILQ